MRRVRVISDASVLLTRAHGEIASADSFDPLTVACVATLKKRAATSISENAGLARALFSRAGWRAQAIEDGGTGVGDPLPPTTTTTTTTTVATTTTTLPPVVELHWKDFPNSEVQRRGNAEARCGLFPIRDALSTSSSKTCGAIAVAQELQL